MRDYFSELYEWDEDGNKRRKKRVARDREQIHFPVTVMDHSAFRPTFSDGSPDHTSPHRPGYRFADTGDAARLAADEAYEARSRRMETAWQHRGEQHDAAASKNLGRPKISQATLDELRAAADAAWEDRSKRMSNAWRQRQEA
jgi:hypothetical protein